MPLKTRLLIAFDDLNPHIIIEIVLLYVFEGFTDDESALMLIMAWCLSYNIISVSGDGDRFDHMMSRFAATVDYFAATGYMFQINHELLFYKCQIYTWTTQELKVI